MKVNLIEFINGQEKDTLGWFFCNSITDQVMGAEDFDPRNVEITMTINGKEVPAIETIREMMRQYHAQVAEEAMNLLNRRLHDVVNVLDNVQTDLQRLVESRWEEENNNAL